MLNLIFENSLKESLKENMMKKIRKIFHSKTHHSVANFIAISMECLVFDESQYLKSNIKFNTRNHEFSVRTVSAIRISNFCFQ